MLAIQHPKLGHHILIYGQTFLQYAMRGSVAVGVPYIYRLDALRRLLASANDLGIDTFYIADNSAGNVEDELDFSAYTYDIEVLNLEYHVGQGACRAAIASTLDEDYLVVADSDMELPYNLHVLQDILHEHPTIGGVSGVLIEGNYIRSGCRNIHEVPLFFGRTGLEIGIREQPVIHNVSGRYVGFFDYLTNAAMIRQACFDDYSWDESMFNMAHEDFYVGHYHHSDWKFACCPEVYFRHYRGETSNYPKDLPEKYEMKTAEEVFKRKWGYSEFVWGKQREWLTSNLYRSQLKYLVKHYFQPRYYLLPREAKRILMKPIGRLSSSKGVDSGK